MKDEIDTLVDALWSMIPADTINSEADFKCEILENNHDIDIEIVNFIQ